MSTLLSFYATPRLVVAPAFENHTVCIDLTYDEARIVIQSREIGVNTRTTVNAFRDCHGCTSTSSSTVNGFATLVPINEVESVYALLNKDIARTRTLIKYIELYALHTLQVSHDSSVSGLTLGGFNACLKTPISEHEYTATLQMVPDGDHVF